MAETDHRTVIVLNRKPTAGGLYAVCPTTLRRHAVAIVCDDCQPEVELGTGNPCGITHAVEMSGPHIVYVPITSLEPYQRAKRSTHRFGTHRGSPYIECLRCGMRSFHPLDIDNRYCAYCHRYHD